MAASTDRGPEGQGRSGTWSLVLLMLLAVAAVGLLAFWDERRESAAALDDFAEEQAALAGSVASELATRLAAARRDGLLIAESFDEGRDTPATELDGYVVTRAERVRDRELRAAWRLTSGVLLAGGLVFAFGTAALRRQRRGLTLERELALAEVTRERDAELAAASRAATLGTLAMGIAHEVSTPLGVIAGRAEQLLPRVDDERSARAVRAILDQTYRIRGVIGAFLDVVRVGAPALGDTLPAAVLGGALAFVEHRFTAAGITLSVCIAPDLPAIHGDARMLQQGRRGAIDQSGSLRSNSTWYRSRQKNVE